MFCVKCGKEIPEGSKFCVSCGQKVQSDKSMTGRPGGITGNKKFQMGMIISGVALAVLLVVAFSIKTIRTVKTIRGMAGFSKKNTQTEQTLTKDQLVDKSKEMLFGSINVSVDGIRVAAIPSTLNGLVYTIAGKEYVFVGAEVFSQNFAEAVANHFAEECVDECIHDSASIETGVFVPNESELDQYSLKSVMSGKEQSIIKAIKDSFSGADNNSFGLEFLWDHADYDENMKELLTEVIEASTSEWKFDYRERFYLNTTDENLFTYTYIAKVTAKNALGNDFYKYYESEKRYFKKMGKLNEIPDAPKGTIWLTNKLSYFKKVKTNVGEITVK